MQSHAHLSPLGASRSPAQPTPADEILSVAALLDLATVVIECADSAPRLSREAERIASTAIGEAAVHQAITVARRSFAESSPLSIGRSAQPPLVGTWAGGGRLRICHVRRGATMVIAVVIEGCWDRPSPTEKLDGLTQRERDVAALIAVGKSNKEVAARLGLSTHTVRHHTERVFTKLGVRTRAAVGAAVGWQRPTDRGWDVCPD